MSLINDALKRVKTAQQQAPPSASIGLQLKPVEPLPVARSVTGVLLPVAVAAVALLALLLFWNLRNKSDFAATTPVRAQTTTSQSVGVESGRLSPVAKLEPAALALEGVSNRPAPRSDAAVNSGVPPVARINSGNEGARQLSSIRKSEPGGAAAPNEASRSLEVPTSTGLPGPSEGISATNQTRLATSVTNIAGTHEEMIAKPPPLKLQGIVFDPKRPSAVISGRTVFVGDRIRQMRVAAITAETATLTDAGHTNVLSLAE
jgi:hypothetical protein